MSCYICLEPCNNQSPCECGAHVHLKCLLEYAYTTKNTHCSICKDEMEEFVSVMEFLELLPNKPIRPKARRINMASCVFFLMFIFSLAQVIYSYCNDSASNGVTYTDVIIFVLLVFPVSSMLAACCSINYSEEEETEEIDVEFMEPYQP